MPKPLERRLKRRNYRNDSNNNLMTMMTISAQRAPKNNKQSPTVMKTRLRTAATGAGKPNSPTIGRAFDPVAYAAALEVLG